MKGIHRIICVAGVVALVVATSGVALALEETCPWDATGTYDATGKVFYGDGDVTRVHESGKWWLSDAYACYMVREDGGSYAAYGSYFPLCDQDGDGHILMADVWEIYNNQGPCPCSDAECGYPPMAPMYLCPDYSWGGNIGLCERSENGVCGWVFRECPTPCEPIECGPPLGAPTYQCADGTWGGNIGVCQQNEDGICGWVMRDCPEW